jgi:tetratricopeptide (TPR) repeat protein
MAKQSWREQRGGRGAVGIGAILALLLVAGRAAADGAAPAHPAPAAAPQEARSTRALALHDEARALYAEGRYRDAVVRLEAAQALDPEAKELVYNLALIHERLGEVDTAALYYRRYLAMETAPKERAKIQSVLRRLEGAREDLDVARDPPGLAPRAAAASTAPPRVIGPWIVATGIVGATGIVTGAILGISALARSPGADATTGPGLTADQLVADATAAHRQAVGADIALLVGLAATGAAVVLYATSRGAPSPLRSAPSPRVAVALGPFSGALQVSF